MLNKKINILPEFFIDKVLVEDNYIITDGSPHDVTSKDDIMFYHCKAEQFVESTLIKIGIL